MNPSFTPITYDMSMMTSEDGKNNFNKKLETQFYAQGEWHHVEPKDLNLYSLRIPLILFYEQLALDIVVNELRYGICYQMEVLSSSSVESFRIKDLNDSGDGVFGEAISCVESL